MYLTIRMLGQGAQFGTLEAPDELEEEDFIEYAEEHKYDIIWGPATIEDSEMEVWEE